MRNFIISFLCALTLAGCSRMNTIHDGTQSDVMLEGFDPVSYFEDEKPAIGQGDIFFKFDNVVYKFKNNDNLKKFETHPEKYIPQYGGFCANGAPYGIMMGGLAKFYKIVNDKLYIFADPISRSFWEMDQEFNIKTGDHLWVSEMKGRIPLLQSYKRIIFRVPHYKTTAQLTEQLQNQLQNK